MAEIDVQITVDGKSFAIPPKLMQDITDRVLKIRIAKAQVDLMGEASALRRCLEDLAEEGAIEDAEKLIGPIERPIYDLSGRGAGGIRSRLMALAPSSCVSRSCTRSQS